MGGIKNGGIFLGKMLVHQPDELYGMPLGLVPTKWLVCLFVPEATLVGLDPPPKKTVVKMYNLLVFYPPPKRARRLVKPEQ